MAWTKDERKFVVLYRKDGTDYTPPRQLDVGAAEGVYGSLTAADVRRLITRMDHGEYTFLEVGVKYP